MTASNLDMDNFISQIRKNLDANGFPAKKVSFALEKMYELADNRGLNFNQVREELKSVDILSMSEGDKIIFYQKQQQKSNIQDQLKQAQEMFEQMSDDEKKNIYEQFQRMSAEEKQDIFKKAKDMGIT